MRSGILLRGTLGVVSALALTTTGLLAMSVPAGAVSPATIAVTPSTGIQPTGSTPVTVTGSGFADTSHGALVECNNDPAQPTIAVGGNPTPVSCGPAPLGPNGVVFVTSATGTFSSAFTVATGTVGPPETGIDSTGSAAAADAAKYPCPPTTAQQAAGDSCYLSFGDASGDVGTENISFAGPCVVPQSPVGYDLAASDGGVFSLGNLPFCGSAGGTKLNKPIVGMALTHGGGGYWLAASDGGVFNYGNAGFFGSAGGMPLNKPIVGMAATKDAGGYWLVASDGGVFNYGDATLHGSAGGTTLNKPIVGMAATSDGGGYWLVASDGGVFSYGDAVFHGSAGGTMLNKPIVGMAATSDGGGYWLVASDGGVFAYGDAVFYGSTGGTMLNQPIVGIAPSGTGRGYWLVAADGGIFNYGDAPFSGSTGNIKLNQPIVGMAAA
jgi:hypothetical protein